jgi:hypothetical protein
MNGLAIDLFTKPTEHPYGMLSNVRHAHEHEAVLATMLIRCVDAGEWIAMPITDAYGTLEQEELVQSEGRKYRLTEKAKGLLYAHYGVTR